MFFSPQYTKLGTSGPLPFSQGLSPFTAILYYASQQVEVLNLKDLIMVTKIKTHKIFAFAYDPRKKLAARI